VALLDGVSGADGDGDGLAILLLTLGEAEIDGGVLGDCVGEAVSEGDGDTLGVAEMHRSGGVTVASAAPFGPTTVDTVLPSEHAKPPIDAKPDIPFASVPPPVAASAYV